MGSTSLIPINNNNNHNNKIQSAIVESIYDIELLWVDVLKMNATCIYLDVTSLMLTRPLGVVAIAEPSTATVDVDGCQGKGTDANG